MCWQRQTIQKHHASYRSSLPSPSKNVEQTRLITSQPIAQHTDNSMSVYLVLPLPVGPRIAFMPGLKTALKFTVMKLSVDEEIGKATVFSPDFSEDGLCLVLRKPSKSTCLYLYCVGKTKRDDTSFFSFLYCTIFLLCIGLHKANDFSFLFTLRLHFSSHSSLAEQMTDRRPCQDL